jgi:YggT family protein
MLLQIGQLLIETLFGFFVFLLLLRFTMQLLRAPFRNPLGEFVITLTNWMVLPTRRIVPGLFGVDLSSLALAWIAEALMLYLLGELRGMATGGVPAGAWVLILVVAALELVRFSIYLLIGVVLVQVVLSWVNPYNPLSSALNSLTRPFYRVFSRFIPPIGNIDLSPLFVLLAAQIALIVLGGLTRMISGAF